MFSLLLLVPTLDISSTCFQFPEINVVYDIRWAAAPREGGGSHPRFINHCPKFRITSFLGIIIRWKNCGGCGHNALWDYFCVCVNNLLCYFHQTLRNTNPQTNIHRCIQRRSEFADKITQYRLPIPTMHKTLHIGILIFDV